MLKIDKQHLKIGKKRSGKRITPKYITIHSTGNPKSTAQNERDYLTNLINTNSTGWHYVVSDKTIIEAIPPTERAWHAGDGKDGTGNNKSIGIEMVETGNRDMVIHNTLKLVKYLQKEYNIGDDKVVRHYDWSGKNCPRILSKDNWKGWRDFKMSLKEIKEEKDKHEPSKWAKEAWEKATKEGLVDGKRPKDFATREEIAVIISRLK